MTDTEVKLLLAASYPVEKVRECLKAQHEHAASWENTAMSLTARLTIAQEHVLEMFAQSCADTERDKFKYDHQCISAYEDAQAYLIEQKLIKAEDCRRK